jgi:fibronectin type 3 domain-containing protein
MMMAVRGDQLRRYEADRGSAALYGLLSASVLLTVLIAACSSVSNPSGGQAPPVDAAPSAPTALTVAVASSTQINLSWTASTGATVAHYSIERCAGGGCTDFSEVATSTATTYGDSAVSAATPYTYRVRASDAAGNLSDYSNTASATTTAATDTEAPTPPGSVSAAAASSAQIDLTWAASTDNVGVAAYLVERCAGSGCSNFVQIATPAGATYSDTTAAPATTYLYRVRAKDAAGNMSGYSNTASATTTAPPDTQPPTAPSGLSASAVSATEIDLVWTDSSDNVGVTGYLVERCTGAGCGNFVQIATATGTSFKSSGLNPATSYSYRVRATDAAGNLSGYSATASAATPATGSAHTDVLTYKNDVARTGQNLTETILTPSTVNSSSFGLLRVLPADGAVYAQPLYVAQLSVGGSLHNVVYVVTEHNSAYAYDADAGTQLWHASLSPSGETASDNRGCDQIQPEIGATATPVIDRTAGTSGAIYVVAMSKDGTGAYHQRLHALDLATGGELFAGPREIEATYPNQSGSTTFDPSSYKERAALLLQNGEIYTTWSSHCDNLPYSGWVIAYDQLTLARTRVLNLGPNSAGNGPGIWHGGGGPAADAAGNVYILTGNGAFEPTLDANGFPSAQDYGNSFVRLSTAGGSLVVADYFAMWNAVSESNADLDLGASGPLLLPDLSDGSGNTKHLIVGAGKDGNVYVVDRDSMSKYNASRNDIWQEIDGAVSHGMRTTGAYFNGQVYFADRDAPVKAFPITNAKLSTSPGSATAGTFNYPGASPVISANGASTGIVWAVEIVSPAVLHAYNAANLATELYNSKQAAGGRDNFGASVKFTTPTVADGKVFVPSQTGVGVFGPLH